MKCFYHESDLDGHCSGAIIKMKYPECDMIGVDHDYSSTIFNSVEKGEAIYIVDFSFSIEEMVALNKKADLVWIDHHKSAIEKMKDIKIAGVRHIGSAGCELTWYYEYPNQDIPQVVYLLGRYDVWDHTDSDVLSFQYGMRAQKDTSPNAKIWSKIIQPQTVWSYEADQILHTGNIIFRYEITQNEKFVKTMFWETKFEGYRAIVVNKPFSNSKIFDSVYNPDRHDIMIIFGYKSPKFKYSLFCNKPEIDVSEIAMKFGGGGHKGAAGFYSNEILIK